MKTINQITGITYTTATINSNKRRILEENWREYNGNCASTDDEMTFADYVRREAENDPSFFRWLFDDDCLSDFECKDKAAFENFLEC